MEELPIAVTDVLGGADERVVMPQRDEVSWTIMKMKASSRIVVDAPLFEAFRSASSPHTLRALKSDLKAFDLWCRRENRFALPATPETVADYLDARAGQGAKPASLGRYKASIGVTSRFVRQTTISRT